MASVFFTIDPNTFSKGKEEGMFSAPLIDSGMPALSWSGFSMSFKIKEEEALLAFVCASDEREEASFPSPERFVNPSDISFSDGKIKGRYLSLSLRFLGCSQKTAGISSIRFSADTGEIQALSYDEEALLDGGAPHPSFDLSGIGLDPDTTADLESAFGKEPLLEMKKKLPWMIENRHTPRMIREAAKVLSGGDAYLCEHNLFSPLPSMVHMAQGRSFRPAYSISLFLERMPDMQKSALFHKAIKKISPNDIDVYVYPISQQEPCSHMDACAALDRNAKILLPKSFCLDTGSKIDSTGFLAP